MRQLGGFLVIVLRNHEQEESTEVRIGLFLSLVVDQVAVALFAQLACKRCVTNPGTIVCTHLGALMAVDDGCTDGVTSIGLDNLALSQPACNLRVAWQLGTEKVLQLNEVIGRGMEDRIFLDQLYVTLCFADNTMKIKHSSVKFWHSIPGVVCYERSLTKLTVYSQHTPKGLTIPSNNIYFRFVKPSDVEELRALYEECFPVSYPDSWFQDLITKPCFIAYVALVNDRIIGILVAKVVTLGECAAEDRKILDSRFPLSSHVAYILSLGVTEAYRSNGIGSLDELVASDLRTEQQGHRLWAKLVIPRHFQLATLRRLR
ncbi:N-acetyltransferase 15 [Clonorchis sinensis]|uniref:N-alpha-acetyltransferase 60 n=1 Tax=Clonorchis sinensis TaxID=79923 RepID=G7Y3Y7_CLOSI|nr:N-acetyltransferase 15 [Clonorchis sinensis]